MQTATADIVKLLDKHKAVAAFFAPLILGIIGIAAHWVVSGEWNVTETKAIIGATLMSIGSAFATWATPTTKAEVVIDAGSTSELDVDPVVPPGMA